VGNWSIKPVEEGIEEMIVGNREAVATMWKIPCQTNDEY
jgi:hypothetical protein